MTDPITHWTREPRSLPYRQGWCRGYHGTEAREYPAGSVESDAYWFGYFNGKAERKLDALTGAV